MKNPFVWEILGRLVKSLTNKEKQLYMDHHSILTGHSVEHNDHEL